MRLFEARLGRPRPHLDDKVLTAWNGLMIAALARMARVASRFAGENGEPYLQAAQRAATFIRTTLWQSERRILLRRFRKGQAEIDGYADDYAYIIFGLLELFQADGDPAWIEWALALQQRQDDLFWDEADGGWFSTTGQDPSVLLRMKEDYDGAEPSASSVSVLNLLALSHLVESPRWIDRIERTLRRFGPQLEQLGRGVPLMAAALSTAIAGVQQVVIVGADAERERLARVIAGRYLPFAISIEVRPEYRERLASVMPLVSAMAPPSEGAAAYMCRNFACQSPVRNAHDLEGSLA